MSEKVRAFLSIDINDDSLLANILQIQQQLDRKSAKMKLVERENIHFTWRFFGDTTLDQIEEIHSELAQLEIEPFTVDIGGVGAFPSKKRPRVIWIGVQQGIEHMRELKTRTDLLLANVGYAIERKKFIPHATIARVRDVYDPDRILHSLQDLSEVPAGTMNVIGVRMTKSTLTPSGPIYETLWEVSS
ncbi:MAG: RNA 2',3'-cyclic phosphodiesterase [Candidatus Thorarchaeota archaeon]